jgi:cell wall-associated NlpC family hydrolase
MRQLGYFLLFAFLSACTAKQTNDLLARDYAVTRAEDAHLDPAFWIGRQRAPERILLDERRIAAVNTKLIQIDSSMNDLERVPAILSRSQVSKWIEAISARPRTVLFGESGELAQHAIDELIEAANLDAVAEQQPARYGLVVRRADLRAFPTRMRAFRTPEEVDIDRFQESAVFPGTPVVIVHTSKDGEWLFVVTPRYRAWIERDLVAEGTAAQVFEYTRKAPHLVVTGSTVRTVFTPEDPRVSELQLDMGVRLPLLTEWPDDQPVNGQHPSMGHVVELPVRSESGALQFTAALLPRAADVSTHYLPFTEANLVRQSFKFLGERYGWGHSYNARDCSGFVSEVYRSFGLQLPRNTRDQAVSTAFERIALSPTDPLEQRLELLRSLRVGDLVFVPGHVMMVIGHERGVPYVIHDTANIHYRRGSEIVRVPVNGVAVTPLTPHLIVEERGLIDQIYSIQRIR